MNTTINTGALLNNRNTTETASPVEQIRGKANFGAFLKLLRTQLDSPVYKEFNITKSVRPLSIDPGLFTELVRKEFILRIGTDNHTYKYKLNHSFGKLTATNVETIYREYVKRGNEERAIRKGEPTKPKHIARVKQTIEEQMQVNPMQDIALEALDQAPTTVSFPWSNGFVAPEAMETPALKTLKTSWEIDGVSQGISITITGDAGSDYQSILKKGLALLDFTC